MSQSRGSLHETEHETWKYPTFGPIKFTQQCCKRFSWAGQHLVPRFHPWNLL